MSGVIAKYHCNYCQEDITGIRVKCAECPDFDLCLECFSSGAEMGAHKNGHSYQLIDCGNFPIFHPPCNWKAKEELTLLEAIEQYGFGNWEDVSQCLAPRTAEDVKDHYNSLYILGNMGKATLSVGGPSQVKDHTMPEGGPLSPSLDTPTPNVEVSLAEQQELGYMPCRDDYEREFDNDAETLISQLAIQAEDDEIEVALKLAHVDMYSRRLKERMRKKAVAREYHLVAQFFQHSKGRTPSSVKAAKRPTREEDKEFQEKMRPFCQFQPGADHEQMFENLEREKVLKSRIKELMRYRRNGITKLEECGEFDLARHRREKRKENKRKSQKYFSILGCVTSAHRRASSMGSRKHDEKGSVDTLLGDQEGDTKEEPKEAIDIATLPGYELLSEKERKLCSSSGISPAYYITFKAVILKDQGQQQGSSSNRTIRPPAGLDRTNCRRILNHFANSGWISASRRQPLV
ncbi:transcriptional adapter 2-beta-like isoform X1 [Ornithodoros turicata]|uniref:transcriptional adapter 2-beta-like isoform X1 n=1 Tax=Ornithodoros turicata TaxID=34597 RepID=UPI00313951CE